MSKRGTLTERLIRIPLILAERQWSQQELIREFGVDAVTIRRTMQDLIRFYPIVDNRHGREVFYKFEGHKFTPPNFTPAELATLLLAQQSIAATDADAFGSPLAGYGRTLLDKIRAALPQSLRDYLDTLANIFGAATIPAKDYKPHAETIDRLTKAAAACRRVQMRYHTLHDDTIKERQFDPYAIYFDPDGATLKTIGLDPNDGVIKPFSIDRILHLTETEESFTRPPGFNLHQFLTDNCFNGIHGEPLLVRLKATGQTARVFAERRFHPSQKPLEHHPKTADHEETIIVEMTVARGRGLLRFVLSWGEEIEVLSPDELRQQVAAVCRRTEAQYSEPQ